MPRATALQVENLPFVMLLDEAVRRTRQSLGPVFGPLIVPIALLSTAFALAQFGFAEKAASVGANDAAGAEALFEGCMIFVLVGIPAFALMGLLYTALWIFAHDRVTGRERGLGQIARFLVSGRVLGTLFLTGLFVGLSYACCVFPVFYVVPLLSLTIPVMAEEEVFGMDAIRRSARLTRFNPRRRLVANPITKVFVLLFVAWLLSMMVNLVVQIPFEAAKRWAMIRNLGDESAELFAFSPLVYALQAAGSFFGSAASAVMSLYTGFGVSLLFFDTRQRKEGRDLEAAIEAIDRDRGPEPADSLSKPALDPFPRSGP